MTLASVSYDEHLAIATLSNSPLNTLSLELFADLGQAVDEVKDSQARALLLRSDGPIFSSGADVGMFVGKNAAEAKEMVESVFPVLWRLEDLPTPVRVRPRPSQPPGLHVPPP